MKKKSWRNKHNVSIILNTIVQTLWFLVSDSHNSNI
jgi:hypothetical protein